MSKALDPVLKNEYMKRVYQKLGKRRPYVERKQTKHYRVKQLNDNGGWLVLNDYKGPEIAASEWESLEYLAYPTDPDNLFAPLASSTGKVELKPFWDHGMPDKGGVWTTNAKKAPNLVKWVESVGANFGRLQLLKQSPSSVREARYAVHLDDNNRLNPEPDGWVVRVWLELTDDPNSYMILREGEFDRKTEARISMPKGRQLIVDSERLFHAVANGSGRPRYALIASFESGPALEKWIASQGVIDWKSPKF